MERKRRISAPFLRTGLNNYRQSKTAAQPENTIIALIQAGIADNIFSPIILWAAGPGWEDSGAVVLRHLLVGLVEHRFRPGVLDHTGLEVVWCEDAGNAAEIPVGAHMAGDPGLLLHVQKGLCVGVSAVWQHRHKQIGVQPLPGVCVHQSCCLARPVHLHGLAGLVFQVHGGFGLVDIVCVVLVELGGFVGQLSVLTALLAVFHPQQAQGDAALLHLSVYPS